MRIHFLLAALLEAIPAPVADVTQAEKADMGLQHWIGLSSVGAGVVMTGLVAWLVWHVVSKALPKMQDNHIKAMADQEKACTDELSQARKDFLTALDKQQISYMAALDRERQSHSDVLQRIEGHWERIEGHWTKSLDGLYSRIQLSEEHAKANADQMKEFRDFLENRGAP